MEAQVDCELWQNEFLFLARARARNRNHNRFLLADPTNRFDNDYEHRYAEHEHDTIINADIINNYLGLSE